jgi:lipoprotein-releasing system permease protein
MPYELFLALRYLTARRRGRAAARVTALAALVGIACGVAALTVALALANGFRDEMRDKILRGTAHITLTRTDGQPITDPPALINALRTIDGITAAEPTTYTGALLTGPDNAAYTVLRGVAPDAVRTLTNLRRTLIAGDSETLWRKPTTAHDAPNDARTTNDAGAAHNARTINNPRTPSAEQEPPVDLIIGAELATRTGLQHIGDEGWLITGEHVAEPPGLAPDARRVRVAGIFRTGLYEFDSSWAYLALADALSFESAPQGSAPVISLETDDIYRTPETAARVRATLGAEYTTVDWQEANRPLFAALALERRTVGLIIALVLFVAALNITTTLVLVVTERRADIAILTALGARAPSIMLIFISEGAIIGALGALAGVALGLTACFIGERYGLVRLPSEVYSLSAIPFHPHASETIFAALGAFILCLLATLYPARSAARLRPVEALRYE